MPAKHEPHLTLGPYQAVMLSLSDVERMQALFLDAADHFVQCTESAPSATEAEEVFATLPPGKSPEDDFVIGLTQQGDELVGIIDIVKDYPEAGCWFLGWLLLRPAHRNLSHGQAVHRDLAEWARGRGAKRLQLGVVDRNPAGLRFWERLGYVEISRSAPLDPSHGREVRVLELALTG